MTEALFQATVFDVDVRSTDRCAIPGDMFSVDVSAVNAKGRSTLCVGIMGMERGLHAAWRRGRA